MDINSLLSPQDSPARETPPPSSTASYGTPKKRPSGPEKRSSSSLSQQITLTQAVTGHPTLSQYAAALAQHQQQQETPSPTLASLSTQSDRLAQSATSTPTIESRGAGFAQDTRMGMPGRLPSTPQMDTLAGAKRYFVATSYGYTRNTRPKLTFKVQIWHPCNNINKSRVRTRMGFEVAKFTKLSVRLLL